MDYEMEHVEGFNKSMYELEQFYADFNFTEIWELDDDLNTESRLINDEIFRRRMLSQSQLKVDTSKFFKGILEIPVIIHILYNPNHVYYNPYSDILDGDIININDHITNERITSQLLRLNIDLLGLNDNFIPSIWSSLKANFNMTLKLHKIIRKETDVQQFRYETTDPNQGGDAVIDRDHYLNLYVAALDNLWGWATYPIWPAHEDAATIDWAVFGDNTFNNENDWFFEHPAGSLGKTATHEVGHWLFLRHPWGHDDNAHRCDTDFVDDTPEQSDPHWYCPRTDQDRQDMNLWPKTCDDKVDMWSNYMSYSWDLCQSLFTKGQLERSLAILRLPSGEGRATLIDYQNNTEWTEDRKFINHIYFRVFTELVQDNNLICGPTDQLISDQPISTEIIGRFVYGCYALTSNSYVDIVTDLKIVENMNEAGDGFSDYCMETNLYKVDDPRYLCYKKGDFDDEGRMNVITMDEIRDLLDDSILLPIETTNYILIPKLFNYADGESYCNNMYGTNLASIHSLNERNEISDLCNPSWPNNKIQCWIGLDDRDDENNFSWIDGSPLDFENWGSGANPANNEPNEIRDCVDIGTQGRPHPWSQIDCSIEKYVICNK